MKLQICNQLYTLYNCCLLIEIILHVKLTSNSRKAQIPQIEFQYRNKRSATFFNFFFFAYVLDRDTHTSFHQLCCADYFGIAPITTRHVHVVVYFQYSKMHAAYTNRYRLRDETPQVSITSAGSLQVSFCLLGLILKKIRTKT